MTCMLHTQTAGLIFVDGRDAPLVVGYATLQQDFISESPADDGRSDYAGRRSLLCKDLAW